MDPRMQEGPLHSSVLDETFQVHGTRRLLLQSSVVLSFRLILIALHVFASVMCQHIHWSIFIHLEPVVLNISEAATASAL